VFEAVNVRLDAGLKVVEDLGEQVIVVADLVVAGTDDDGLVIDSAEVALVGGDRQRGAGRLVKMQLRAAAGCLVKMQLRAAAGIDFYLIVESEDADGVVLRLHRPDGAQYVEESVTGAGEKLTVDRPFPIDLDPASLPRR
jgi:hypothetical protein